MTEEKKTPNRTYTGVGSSYYENGIFYPDQTPLEIPLGYQIPETLQSMIARMVENAQFRQNPELDSIDEADDFDVMDEEPIHSSKHEFTEMQEEHYKREKTAAFNHADERIRESQERKPHGETDAPEGAEQHQDGDESPPPPKPKPKGKAKQKDEHVVPQ